MSFLVLAFGRTDAFNGRHGVSQTLSYSSSWYASPSYVAPSYWALPYYCVPTPHIVPVPDAVRVPNARPTAAPPSQSAEPPLNRSATEGMKAPVIIANHAQPNARAPLLKDRCRVGFWNLTGRDVTLTVDGKTWTLPRDRATTLDLDRQFTWHADQQTQRNVSVPDGQSTFEVVIR
jgi:hypothetical protein